MKKLKFDLPDARQIEINGHVFDIHKADIDVMEKASELRNEYSKLTVDKEIDIDEVIAAVKSIINYIDEMLGDGATLKIMEGKPLGIVKAVELMTMICKAVVEEYNEDMKDKYE